MHDEKLNSLKISETVDSPEDDTNNILQTLTIFQKTELPSCIRPLQVIVK